jgi:hypothetical protein
MRSIYSTRHCCIDKPAYPTVGEAVRTMYRAILRKNCIDPRIHPYQCPFHPNHVHLGKSRPERKAA